MNEQVVSYVANLSQIVGFIFTCVLGGWAAYKWIYKIFIKKVLLEPIKKHLNDVNSSFKTIDKVLIELNTIKNDMTNNIMPVINSISSEFSKNGGKSIKDRIQRIDDLVVLSELRSKMIASNLITTGAYECDINGETTWVNKALCEIFGLSMEDMMGNGWLKAEVDKDRATVWKNWLDAVKNDIPHEAEYTVRNQKTNDRFRVRATTIAHKTIDGKILGYYGTIIKI